jgi:L-threonylcarbamoyladenylate synthase
VSAPLSIAAASIALRQGAVIACPTEAVWGLGCDPFDQAAVTRLLAIKQREVDKGLILVAGSVEQFDGLADWAALPVQRAAEVRASWPGPNTWIIPATQRVPRWITGAHDSVALRVSAHPVVVALCEAFDGPLVSTSANLAGAPPPRSLDAFDPSLLAMLDGVVAGKTGSRDRPSDIRDARSGAVLRGIAAALLATAMAWLPAPPALAQQVTVYRCVAADGRVSLRDSPCADGERQQVRTMQKPKDAPPPATPVAPAPAPARPETPAPPRVIVLRTPQPMYECVTPDGEHYTSATPEGNPRWVPLWTLGWPVYEGAWSNQAGTWIRDACSALPQPEVCARLDDRRDEIRHRFFQAMPSERERLDVEQRAIEARMDADCGGH